uniref:CX domain-containing protein n=1 Tax=Plectus sambesii TaxID=2011161 RepID=A0A914WTR5_9BILA
MDPGSNIFLNRFADNGDYVKCFYELAGNMITKVTVLCEKELGCCDQGCCETRPYDNSVSFEGIYQDQTKINGSNTAVWCIVLTLLAIAFLLLLCSTGIMAWKRYRSANATTSPNKEVVPNPFPTYKIRPVEFAPNQPDATNNV